MIEGYKPPRYDLNSPDLYIPGISSSQNLDIHNTVMAYITYIILVGISMGRNSKYTLSLHANINSDEKIYSRGFILDCLNCHVLYRGSSAFSTSGHIFAQY